MTIVTTAWTSASLVGAPSMPRDAPRAAAAVVCTVPVPVGWSGRLNVLRAPAPRSSSVLKALSVPLGLLIVVPVAPALQWLVGAPPIWVFLAGALAIGVLADWLRCGTEQMTEYVGPAIGGLLNVSFGSLAEVILTLFVLARGEAKVV